ncbi:MAG: UDP-galactopyranose mutase [Phycisphaerae bacterium]|nr:UDP-galactopyranose mutase [Gemmatimonadaceae bacterium]
MTRFAKQCPVYYFEEGVDTADVAAPQLQLQRDDPSGVCVVTPLFPNGWSGNRNTQLQTFVNELVAREGLQRPVLWYYTPMMLSFSSHLRNSRVVYDCMDELANFKFAPADILEREQQLLNLADVVFTGGYSLYEHKRTMHANVHPFPSSVDVHHFAQARELRKLFVESATSPAPRFGFHGVIDERMDLELLAEVADAKPEWQWVMVGPVVKIDPASLPVRANIHYLGSKTYNELPGFLASLDVAIMPFAINDATRFISPTKTPEYFAGGLPVVSTEIRDVAQRYGHLQALKIGSSAAEFLRGCEAALELTVGSKEWRDEVDAVLSQDSWDATFQRMLTHVTATVSSVVPIQDAPAARDSQKSAPHYDYLVVGAGFAGSVLAERLAAGSGKKVLVIDRRDHIAGNAFDEYDEAGVLVHRYGPHIFHTNSDRIFQYLSRFTEWRQYEHRVLASVGDQLLPIPINRTTLNMLYDASLQTETDVEAFLAERAVSISDIRTSKDILLSSIGTELYEMFFRGYTQKQWGLDPSQLDKAVAARIPVRTCTDDRYFTDKHQSMPLHGYTRMFENLLDHKNITVLTGVQYDPETHGKLALHTIYSGPIDEYFGNCFGPLPYRSLTFQRATLNQSQFQSVGVVNYPSEDVEYTRITEYKHLTGQLHRQTSLTYEIPSATGEPYYPIPSPANHALYARYVALAEQETNVSFVGRLGTYKYYNMDQVVGQALATYQRLEPETSASAIRRESSLLAYA